MKVKTIGIDLSKNIFHVHGADGRGRAVFSQAFRRARFREFMAKLPPCLIGLEACGGSHYWARELKKMGHDCLPPPAFARPSLHERLKEINSADFSNQTGIKPGACQPLPRGSGDGAFEKSAL